MDESNDAKPPPLAYATPERVTRPGTREIVFACFTLAAGVGYCLAAGWMLLSLVLHDAWWNSSLPPLYVMPIIGGMILLPSSFVIVRASVRIIRGLPIEYRVLAGSSESTTRSGMAALFIAFLQLVVGSAAIALCIFHLAGVSRGSAWGTLATLGASSLAIFTGALVLRLKL